MPGQLSQPAAARPTEKKKSVATQAKATDVKSSRARGRPKGSRNKPKALIPKELASEFLGVVRDILPEEYYKEMRDSIRSGKNISTINEAKILMKLMGPPVWQRLIEESRSVEQVPELDPELAGEIGPEPPRVRPFDRDLNERLKVLLAVMQFVDKMEKQDDQQDNSEKPFLEIFARRGIDAARIEVVTRREPRLVGGDSDGVGRPAIDAGTIPDSVPERQVNLQDSEQVETVRVLNDDISGDDSFSEREEEL